MTSSTHQSVNCGWWVNSTHLREKICLESLRLSTFDEQASTKCRIFIIQACNHDNNHHCVAHSNEILSYFINCASVRSLTSAQFLGNSTSLLLHFNFSVGKVEDSACCVFDAASEPEKLVEWITQVCRHRACVSVKCVEKENSKILSEKINNSRNYFFEWFRLRHVHW